MLLKGTLKYTEKGIITTKQGVEDSVTFKLYAKSEGVGSFQLYLMMSDYKEYAFIQACDTRFNDYKAEKEQLKKLLTAYDKLLQTHVTALLKTKKGITYEEGLFLFTEEFKSKVQEVVDYIKGKNFALSTPEIMELVGGLEPFITTEVGKKRQEKLIALIEAVGKLKRVLKRAEDSAREQVDYFDAPKVVNNWRRIDVGDVNAATNIYNTLLVNRVSAAIKYSLVMSRVEDTMGVQHNAGDALNYIVMGEDDTTYGQLTRQYGSITSFSIIMPYVEIHLESTTEETVNNSTIFKKLQEKDKYQRYMSLTPVTNQRIKLTEEFLGFKPMTTEPAKVTFANGDLYSTFDEVEAAHPDKNFKWVHNKHYEVLSDENIDEVMQEFIAFGNKINPETGKPYLIAVDTETTGLRMNVLSRSNKADKITGICISKELNTGYYIPLGMKTIPNVYGGDAFAFMQRYKKFFETASFVVHNATFDWKVFYVYGVVLNYVMDTQIVFGVTYRYMLGKQYKYSLKALTKEIFGIDQISLNHFKIGGTWGKNEDEEDASTFADLPYEFVKYYACADPDFTLALADYVVKEKILEKFAVEKVYNIELEFARAVAYSEFHGMHIDMEHLGELVDEFETGRNTCMQELLDMAKAMGAPEFQNPSSAPQLQHVIYDVMGLPLIEGKRSTDKNDLKPLAKEENPDGTLKYPFIAKLLEFRKYNVIYNNFIKRRNEMITDEGFVFADVFALGTETGRCSVKNPNYQSYNDVVKKYVRPRAGFKEWDSDFSQIEYRVLCSMAKQTNLMEAFSDPDMDYHQLQASNMFQVPYALVTKDMRSSSKKFNFGLPYGMGLASLAKGLGVSLEEAQVLYDKYFNGQENILNFFETVRAEGVKNGYTRTKYGRLRYYNKTIFSEKAIRRQAGNHVIQGTAADIWKMAVNQVMQSIIDKGWLDKVLLCGFIHDEILGEVSEEVNFFEFVEVWRKSFQIEIDNFCQLYAGLGIGNSWYEAKKQDLSPLFIEEIINSPLRAEWDNDGDKFCKWLKEAFHEHNIRRVRDYIQMPESQGIVIKPAINALLEENTNDYVKGIVKSGNEELIQKYKDLGATIDDKGVKIKGLQTFLKIFCDWQGVDYSIVNVKSPADMEAEQKAKAQEQVKANTQTMQTAQRPQMTNISDVTGINVIAVLQAMQLGFYVKDQDIYINYNLISKAVPQIQNTIFNLCGTEQPVGYHIHMVHDVKAENKGINVKGKLITEYYTKTYSFVDNGKEYLLADMNYYIKYEGINPLITMLQAVSNALAGRK